MSKVRYKQGTLPPLDEAVWAHAVRNPFYQPVKTPVFVRLDANVLAWR